MKKFIVVLIGVICWITNVLSQNDSGYVDKSDTAVISDTLSSFNNNALDTLQPNKKPDTTKLRIGQKSISIIKDGDETYIKVLDEKDDKNKNFDFEMDDDDLQARPEKVHKGKFEPHWAGLEFGLNSYGQNYYSTEIPREYNYMDLNTSRSWNINLNLFDFGVGLIGNYVGIGTGLGLEFNNYIFDNHNSIGKDSFGNIINLPIDASVNVEKSKLATTYLTAPLLLEFQIPTIDRQRIILSGGLIGGIKLGSHTKVIKSDGNEKVRSDFNLSPYRYGVTIRIGFKHIMFFANQYITPLFEKGRGPEIYPFSLGISLCH